MTDQLLTVCCYCKRVIRWGAAPDGNYSHGICRRCMARHHPDIEGYELEVLSLALCDAALCAPAHEEVPNED